MTGMTVDELSRSVEGLYASHQGLTVRADGADGRRQRDDQDPAGRDGHPLQLVPIANKS